MALKYRAFFFPLRGPGSGKALQSKLLKYLDSDTLSYYFGWEMTELLPTASFNFRILL